MSSLSWSAIATGTFIALAVQTVLLLFGLAIATSFGDHLPGTGFGIWMVLVELGAIAIGAALSARLSHAARRGTGIAAGVVTWSVVLVLGTMFQAFTMTRAIGGSGVWAELIGAVASLAAAIVGGAFAVHLAGSSGSPLEPLLGSQDHDLVGPPTHAPIH